MITMMENCTYVMFVQPNSDNELLRESAKFARGRFKGETKEYFTVHMKAIPRFEKINGKERKVTGIMGGIIPYNVFEHNDTDTFNDIYDALEKQLGESEDGGFSSKKPIEVDVVMSGAYYKAPFKHYGVTPDGDVDEDVIYNEIRWFVPEWRNTTEDSLQTAFEYLRDELVEQGRKVKSDDDFIDEQPDPNVENDKEVKKKKAGRRNK